MCGVYIQGYQSSVLRLALNPSHISHPGFFHIRRGGLETGKVFMRALLVCYVRIPFQGFLASSLRKGATQDHLESLTCVLWWGHLGGRAKDEGVSGTGKTPEHRGEDWMQITPRLSAVVRTECRSLQDRVPGTRTGRGSLQDQAPW